MPITDNSKMPNSETFKKRFLTTAKNKEEILKVLNENKDNLINNDTLNNPQKEFFMQATLNKKAEQELTDFLNSLPDLPELIYLFYKQTATDILLDKQKAITTFVQKGDRTHFQENLATLQKRYDNQLKELSDKGQKRQTIAQPAVTL